MIKETKKDWSNEEVRKFLYNSKHQIYYNKDEKQKLWKWIASKLISHGFSEIKYVKNSENITSLRSYYGIEKQKKSIKIQFAGTSEVYVSSWRLVNDLHFLNDNLIKKKSYSNIDLQTEEAFRSSESRESISVKPERLLKLKSLGKN